MTVLILANTAEELVTARREARALSRFPGPLPESLPDAYAVQEQVLALTDRGLAGWKVAAIPPSFRDQFPAERLVGPVFADDVQTVANGGTVEVKVHADGFAAIEAEFVARIIEDLPRDAAGIDADALADHVTLHVGSEIASSPLGTINALGPGAVISDHGNNAGAIVGPEIPRALWADWSALISRSYVGGVLAGEGSAARVAGGPLAAVAFLVRQLAGRGRTLRRGDVVLTGMTTGIHEVRPGDRARIEFPGVGTFDLHVAARRPVNPAKTGA